VQSNVVLADCVQLENATEKATLELIGGGAAKETLDPVDQGRRGRSKVLVVTRMLLLPPLHLLMLVRGVVVTDQVKIRLLSRFAVDLTQELQPPNMAMALQLPRNELSIEHVERGEQRGSAVALVVVGHRRGASLFYGQSRWGALERLQLALLIAAQHQRTLGRLQLRTHDALEFLDKLCLARNLGGFGQGAA
jgi:hypothetical protein